MKLHTRLKRVLATLLLLVTVLSSFSFVTLHGAAARMAWDGQDLDYSWYKQGYGTKSNPYRISSGAQLAAWSALSNGTYDPAAIKETEVTHKIFQDSYFVLTQDIDLGGHAFTPIVAGFVYANRWYAQYGSGLHLDGQGHTIYNLTVENVAPAYIADVNGIQRTCIGTDTAAYRGTALFATLGPNSTVTDLHFVGANISNATITDTARCAAVLAAHASAEGLEISHVTVDNTSSIEGYRYCGGLVTQISENDPAKTDSATRIQNCIVACRIECNANVVGGMVGRYLSYEALSMENCIFNGSISIINDISTSAQIGGMLALSNYAAPLQFTSCINLADFRTTRTDAEYNRRLHMVSGVVAAVNKVQSLTVTQCYDLGFRAFETEGTCRYYAVSSYYTGTGTCTVIASYRVTTDEMAYLDPDNVLASADEVFTVDAATTSTVNKELRRICNMAHAEHDWYADGAIRVCNLCGLRTSNCTSHQYTAGCDTTCNACGETREASLSHLYASDCDTVCNRCEEARAPYADHLYDNDCDTDCNRCKEIRHNVAHTYSASCDTSCNSCGAMRSTSISHLYRNPCAQKCDRCGELRTDAPAHSFTASCDTSCNLCGETRPPESEHQYHFPCDVTCLRCGETRPVDSAHTYDAECDATCNVCGQTRTNVIPHQYLSNCDDTCDLCGQHRETYFPHQYLFPCATRCEHCAAERKAELPHEYSNPCDAFCNVCEEERTVTDHQTAGPCDEFCDLCNADLIPTEEHIWSNACDASCNVCFTLRAVGNHIYDHACDAFCNECFEAREVGDHVTTSLCDEDCNICGQHVMPQENHTFAVPCDPDCDLCGAKRMASPHTFDGPYDFICNLCGVNTVMEQDFSSNVPDANAPTTEALIFRPSADQYAPEYDPNLLARGCKASASAPLLLLFAAALPVLTRKRRK